MQTNSTKKRRVIASCSLCNNFDSLRGICSISQLKKEVYDIDSPLVCKRSGDYIRNLNVIPINYNYYLPDESKLSDFKPDLSRVDKDEAGYPLVINTNRGLERAIPAYEGLQMKVDIFLERVMPAYSLQGQREIIHKLGIDIAREITGKAGVDLIVLEHENESEGIPKEIKKFRENQRVRESFNI